MLLHQVEGAWTDHRCMCNSEAREDTLETRRPHLHTQLPGAVAHAPRLKRPSYPALYDTPRYSRPQRLQETVGFEGLHRALVTKLEPYLFSPPFGAMAKSMCALICLAVLACLSLAQARDRTLMQMMGTNMAMAPGPMTMPMPMAMPMPKAPAMAPTMMGRKLQQAMVGCQMIIYI